jgi:uncharacterized membrane protein YbhN (UPF0104 family)
MRAMRDWRRWLAGAVLVAFAGAAVVYRSDVAAAGREIAALSPAWIAALVVLGAALTIGGGLITKAIVPHLALRHAVMSQQAALAANNTAVASGPVSLGLRIAMLRSWGVDDANAGVVIAGSGVATSLRAWLAAGTISAVALASTARETIEPILLWIVIGVAVAVISTMATVLWLVLRSPRPLAWLGARLHALAARLGSRSSWLRTKLERVDLLAFAEQFRTAGHVAVSRRGWIIAAAGLAELAVMLIAPVVVLRAFGIGAATLSATEIVAVFVLVKMVASLTPIPGGIGVTELGLTATLTRFGAPDAEVLAAVLTYRALTFLLPIAVGAVCLAVWRHRLGRMEPAVPRRPDPVVPRLPGTVLAVAAADVPARRLAVAAAGDTTLRQAATGGQSVGCPPYVRPPGDDPLHT